MIRSFLTVSSGTLVSRLLGFVRDSMIAALLGATPVADAFLMAFQLVNVVRRLLTEGALNASLVPVWLRVRETAGAVAAAGFAGRVLGTVSVTLVIASALIGLLMPLVIAALAPGFTGHETLRLAVEDARLMLPYLAFAGPVTVLMALLNAQGRYALTAFSPLLFNLTLIAATSVLLFRHTDPADAALAIAAAVGIAGLLQLLTLAMRRGAAFASPLRLAFDAEMRGFFAKAIPGMIASAGPQWLVVAGAIIASSSTSAVSWLYFANRLIELPLGIVGAATGAVLVPELSRALHGDDSASMVEAGSRGLELAVGLALPATLGLIVLREPIVRALFQHGAFTALDTTATAQAVIWLALALPAHVLFKALSPAFFARENMRAPLLATLTGFAVAIVAALAFGRLLGTAGIAAGIALGAWSSALALLLRGARTFGLAIDAAARRRLPRIVLAALAMGALLWPEARFVLPATAAAHGAAQLAIVGILIAGGMAIYGLLLVALGGVDGRAGAGLVRRKPARDLRD